MRLVAGVFVIDWDEVFDLRCKAKRGVALTVHEQRMISRAFGSDPERYSAMTDVVFRATAPFGSRIA